MDLYFEIRKKISLNDLIENISFLLNIPKEMFCNLYLDSDENLNKAKIFIELFERPKCNFKTSCSLVYVNGTNKLLIDDKASYMDFLCELSERIDSDIFIDVDENNGVLISSDIRQKVSFDIVDDCIIIGKVSI